MGDLVSIVPAMFTFQTTSWYPPYLAQPGKTGQLKKNPCLKRDLNYWSHQPPSAGWSINMGLAPYYKYVLKR